MFYCSVSVENIGLRFQTLILPLIIIIQWDFCLHKESDNSQHSTQRSDLIIIQSVWNDMKKQNKLRQTKSRRTVATSPRCFKKPTCKAIWKTIASAPRAKAALNAKDGHNKCWFNLVNRSKFIKKSINDIIFDSILILQHFYTCLKHEKHLKG